MTVTSTMTKGSCPSSKSKTVPLLTALDPNFRQPAIANRDQLRPVDTSSNASLAHLRSCALSRLQSSWDAIIHRYSSTCFEHDDEIDLDTLQVVSHHGSLLSHPRPIAFGSLTGYLDDSPALPNACRTSSSSTPLTNRRDGGDLDDNDSEEDELIALAHPTSGRLSHSAMDRADQEADDDDDDEEDDDDLLLLAIRSLRPPLVVVHDDDSEEDELISLAPPPRPPPPPPPSSSSTASSSSSSSSSSRFHASSTPAANATTTSTTPNSAKASSQLLMDAIASASSPMPLPSPLSMYAPSPSSSTSFFPLASPIPRAQLSYLAETPCPVVMDKKRAVGSLQTPSAKGKSTAKAQGKVNGTASGVSKHFEPAPVPPVRRSSRLSLTSTAAEPDLLAPPPTSATGQHKPKSIRKSKPKAVAPSSTSSTSRTPATRRSNPASAPHSDPHLADLSNSPPLPPRRRTRASVVAALDPPPPAVVMDDLPPTRTRTRKPKSKADPPARAPTPATRAKPDTSAPPAAPPTVATARKNPSRADARKRARNPATAPAARVQVVVPMVTVSDSDSDAERMERASPPRKRTRKTNVPVSRRRQVPPVPETPRVAILEANPSIVTPVESPIRQQQPGSPPLARAAPVPRRPRVAPGPFSAPPPLPLSPAPHPATPAGATSVKHASQPVEHVWRYSYAAAMAAKRQRAAALAAARLAGTLTKEQEILSLGGVVWAEMESGTDTEDELVKGATVVVRGRRQAVR